MTDICKRNGIKFQSTPSARRATSIPRKPAGKSIISIHALREEGDDGVQHLAPRIAEFQSTPSARRATSR